MAILDEDKLSKLLKNKTEQNVWFLFGDDAYLKDFYCNKLIDQTVDKELRFFNFHTYEDDDTPLDEIFADAENLPVMCEKTCLLVKNYPLHNLGTKQRETLEAALRDLPETTVLIFFYSVLPVVYNRKQSAKWADVIDLFQKCGVVAELSHRTPAKIIKMLIKGASARNTTIGEDEARYLLETVGDDMQTLLNEFNKVCAYAQGQPVTKKMIDETAVKTVEASVFDISRSIFEGNPDKAFAITNELLRQKTPLQPILGALASAYVNLYRLKLAKIAKKNVSDFAAQMGYKGNSAYVFRNLSAFAGKMRLSAIKQSLDILLEADVKSKSTATQPEILLTEVIAKLSAVAQTEGTHVSHRQNDYR